MLTFDVKKTQLYTRRRRIVKYNCTVVSAYYEIPSKRPSKYYMEWIDNFLKLEVPIVLFTSAEHAPAFKEKRGYLPIIIQIVPFEEIYMWKLYKKKWSEHYEFDPEKSYHSPELYAVWANKCIWLNDVSAKNPFHTNWFLWTDCGCFRDSTTIKDYATTFCRVERFTKGRTLFSTVSKYVDDDYVRNDGIVGNFTKVDGDFKDRLVGTYFGGDKESCYRWKCADESMLLRYFVMNRFAGKDQSIMNSTILEDPTLGEIVESTVPGSMWNFIQLYLSRPGIRKAIYRP